MLFISGGEVSLLARLSQFIKTKREKSAFKNSKAYWERRYRQGGNSGAGSYDRLAEFKAEVLNEFVKDNNIKTVIEFGCGDGNQLLMAQYPNYTGFDVSPTVLQQCKKLFKDDSTKTFKHVDEYKTDQAELSLSLDVIYHLVEDSIFEMYLKQLFSSATKYVIIYSSNIDIHQQVQHVRQRKFTPWIESNIRSWKLVKTIPNRYPFDEADPKNTTFADFFVYQKV